MELEPRDDGLPSLLWTGAVVDGHDPSGPAPRVAKGPGTPLLGEQIPGPADAAAPARLPRQQQSLGPGTTGGSWTPPRLTVDTPESDDWSSAPRRRGSRRHRGARVVPGGALRVRAAVTNTGAGRYVVDGLEIALPVPDHLVEALELHRTPRARAGPHVTRSPTDCGCARSAADGPAWMRRPSSSSGPRASPSPVARCSRSTWRGAATACCGSSVAPRPARRSVAASSCCPARSASRPARPTPVRGSCSRRHPDGLDGLAAIWHTFQRALAAHPTEQPVVLNFLGGRLFRPRPRPAARDRRPGRPGGGGALRPRRRLVPPPP